MTPGVHASIIKMRSEGRSYRDIGAELGVNYSTCWSEVQLHEKEKCLCHMEGGSG